MDPVVSLPTPRVEVAPGSEATVPVVLRNPGAIVVQYDIVVLGEAARWAEVVPSSISLLTATTSPAGAEQTVRLTFRPPRPPAAPAGSIPFGIRCISRENPEESTVEEGEVVVAAVQGLQAELRPVGNRGRRAGHFALVLSNTGTTPLSVTVRANDQGQRLRFAVGPDTVDLPPGGALTSYIAVRPRELMWLGRAVEHPFSVAYRVADAESDDTRADRWTQRAVIPRWVLILGALLVLAVAALVAWVFFSAPEEQVELVSGAQAPPPVAGVTVTPGEPGTVEVAWLPSPYSRDGYLVRLVDEATAASRESRPVDDARQGQLMWPDLPGGRQCFQVAAFGSDEREGDTSALVCSDVVAAPSAPVDPGAGANASGEATPPGTPATSGPQTSPSTTPPPGGTTTTGTGPAGEVEQLRDWFVIYRSSDVADPLGRGELTALTSGLQQSGAAAQFVEGTISPRLADYQVHVVEDRFADRESAQARCDALRSLAEGCIVGPRPAGA